MNNLSKTSKVFFGVGVKLLQHTVSESQGISTYQMKLMFQAG